MNHQVEARIEIETVRRFNCRRRREKMPSNLIPNSSSFNSDRLTSHSGSLSKSSTAVDELGDPQKPIRPTFKKVAPQIEDRCRNLAKTKELFKESNELVDPSLRKEGVETQHLADKISANALSAGAKNLKKLPVYMAARALDGKPRAMRAHGFVAIGKPGVVGAKVFTHFTSMEHAGKTLSKDRISELAQVKTPGYNTQLLDNETIQAMNNLVEKNNGKALNFETTQDFHRAFYMERVEMWLTKMSDPSLTDESDLIEDFEPAPNDTPAERQAKIKEALNNLTDDQLNDFKRVHKEINQEFGRINRYMPVDKTQLRQQTPSGRGKHASDFINSAEMDNRLFEHPKYDSQLTLKKQDVSATDVIEANQLQNLRNRYLDEKMGAKSGMAWAPELAGKIDNAGDAAKMFDTSTKEIGKPEYDSIGNQPQSKMDASKVKQARKYNILHAFNRIRTFFRNTTWFGAKKRDPNQKNIRNIATPGNCNSAAGSLLTLAGELRGQNVKVKSGGWQFGVNVKNYWNPVQKEHLKTVQQQREQSHELETKGGLTTQRYEQMLDERYTTSKPNLLGVGPMRGYDMRQVDDNGKIVKVKENNGGQIEEEIDDNNDDTVIPNMSRPPSYAESTISNSESYD